MRIRIVLAAMICLALSGCFTPRSFLDPSAPRIAYDDLKRPQQPLKLKLTTEFRRNGEPFPKADPILKDNAERILRATGVIAAADDAKAGTVVISVNNIADLGAAAAKGAGVGLTFGLAGTTVMDAYELSIAITVDGKTVTRNAIKRGFYTAIGNTSLPAGIEPVAPNVAFERTLEQMLLQAIKDLQASGELAQNLYRSPVVLASACLRGAAPAC